MNISRAALRIAFFSDETDAINGTQLNIVELAMPNHLDTNQRLPCSYANFICNK
jgi:agmatine/peptidylarginine deiminase